ncbi:MAG: GxxExxY protein [Gemmatimonadaceae bacterium]
MTNDIDTLTGVVIGAAIYVHRMLGPGLLESAYEDCLAWTLTSRGIALHRQRILPVTFEGREIEAAYRIDLLIENQVIVEVKALERVLPVHEAQLRTYLRLSGIKTGLLLNFLVPVMKDGIRRMSM